MLLKKIFFQFLFLGLVLRVAIYPTLAFGFEIPSVGLCMEKTGLTKEQCQEKMKNLGNMSLQEKAETKNKLMGNAVKDNSSATASKNSTAEIADSAVIIENKIKKVQRIKTEKEKQFTQILEKVQKITDFLRSSNADVSEIEKNISTFNEKTANVIGAYEKYIELLEENKTTGLLASDAALKARGMISRSTGELVAFSRATLQENLRLQIISVVKN